uniref:L1 transposable element RRM domain-containing protein n=1 Tax=Latimeria chalumnae TaxID=7897 RepID=H3AK80_LATCH
QQDNLKLKMHKMICYKREFSSESLNTVPSIPVKRFDDIRKTGRKIIWINEIKSSIAAMDKKLETYAKRLDEVEHRIGNMEDSVLSLENTVLQLQEAIVKLQGKTDDLENRSRRCNLRLVGLPEGEEGKDPASFLESWLPKLLNLPELINNLEVERAHRTYAPRERNTDKPHMLLFKLLRYGDKESILRQARKLGALIHNNKPVRIFPDMSAELFQKRKSFSGIKRLCKELDIPFALLFPARLRIDFKGQCLIF